MNPMYVYGIVSSGARIPPGLKGLGPSGIVSTVEHKKIAAIVGDVPTDRPLGLRDDLLAHENVVDSVAAVTSVLPMRFPAVVEEHGVVEELLAPNHAHFQDVLAALEGRVQFSLKGRFEQDVVLREVVEADEDIRSLQQRVRELPEDASYYDRVRLGELIVGALERRRDIEAEKMYERLEPVVADTAAHPPTSPEEVINGAFLVERDDRRRFEEAVEDLGREGVGRLRLRLLGPLAPYDFVS
jgi:hypothetical protein